MLSTHAKTTILSAALVLALFVPGGFVLADNEPGTPDDLVVVVEPRAASTEDGSVLMNAVNGMYIFDFETYHADGSPYLFTEYISDVNTIDPDQGVDTLIYTEEVPVDGPTNEGTVRVPASQLSWGQFMPANGITFTILLRYDENGQSLAEESDDGHLHLPAGQYNLLVNELVAEGNYGEADQADEAFTPIFLANDQPDGLVQVTNPVLNPGFELGTVDAEMGEIASTSVVRDAPAPWAFFATDATTQGPTGTEDSIPFSTIDLVPGQGLSGNAVEVDYDARDNERAAALAQWLTVPASGTGAWIAGDDVTVEYDVRLEGSLTVGGVPSTHHASATLHWVNETGVEFQENQGPTGGVPLDGTWHHVELDFGDIAEGHAINFFAISLWGENFDDDVDFTIDYDNVQIDGVTFASEVQPENDLTDGYSVHIEPLDAVLTDPQEVSQDLVRLANGELAYVYRVSGYDYTDIAPRTLDLGATGNQVFQILDQDFITSGLSHDPENVTYDARDTDPAVSDANFLRFHEADGELSEDLLVVVPAADLPGDAQIVNPWYFADVAEGDTYTETFGQAAEPVSGFYSVARNQFQGLSVADQLDYAATPLRLSGEVGSTMGSASSVSLVCETTDVNGLCELSETSPAATFTATVSTESDVVEETTVELVTLDGQVLDTATVQLPDGGEVSLQIDDGFDLDKQRVFARLLPGAFAEGAESEDMGIFADLSTNLAPVVDAPATVQIEPGNTVSVTASATDDGWPNPLTWEVTTDEDVALTNVVQEQNGDVTFTWEIPTSRETGLTVTFEATDGHLTGTASTDIQLILEAQATLLSPEEVATGITSLPVIQDQALTMRASAHDADDLITRVEIFPEGAGGPSLLLAEDGTIFTGGPFTYATAGTYEVLLEVENSDNIVQQVTRTWEVVENTAPVVSLDDGPIWGNVTEEDGTFTTTLTASVSDPEQRPISADDVAWTLPAGATANTTTGPSISVTMPVGSYDITAEVADVYGLVGSTSVTVNADDIAQAEAGMLGANGVSSEGVAVYNPTAIAGEQLEGEVLVTDADGTPKADADIAGVVIYHGLSATSLGIEVGNVSATTGPDGLAVFQINQTVDLGGELANLASLPGYYEVSLDVAAPSSMDAPLQDLEGTGASTAFWIGPAPAGQTV